MRHFSVGCAVTGAIFLLGIVDAGGNVSFKNGNFFVVYTDIVYPGGFEPKVSRVYNSKTTFKGMFGHGWGTDYEMYLTPQADGSVVVHEWGGGADNLFSPPALHEATLEKVIDRLLRAAKTNGDIGDVVLKQQMRSRLKSDAPYREKQWEKYWLQGLLPGSNTPVGIVLQSDRFSHQVLTRVPEGYIRSDDSGRLEHFDNQGHLIGLYDSKSNWIRLTYGNGKLQELADNLRRNIDFTVNSRRLIEHIRGHDGRAATFRYNERDELIESSDADGNHYQYSYSEDGKHNLIRIAYDDGTTMEMSYYGRDQHDCVRSVKDRDGTLRKYTYDWDSNGSRRKVSINESSADKLFSTSSYEYFIETRRDGMQWTGRMIITENGEEIETAYDKTGRTISTSRKRIKTN